MDSLWSNPIVWASAILIGLVMAGLSAFVQKQVDTKEIKSNAVLRDGLLGAIFTSIIWVLAPDTMLSITSSIKSMVSDSASSVTSSITVPTDVDVQVGPVKF
jgi:hypothetical protein